MTELQTLIRDSNGMPPLIRADYLEDSGFDLEADWLRRGDRKRRPIAEGLGQGAFCLAWYDGVVIGHASGNSYRNGRASDFTDGAAPGIYYPRFFRSDSGQGALAGHGSGYGSGYGSGEGSSVRT